MYLYKSVQMYTSCIKVACFIGGDEHTRGTRCVRTHITWRGIRLVEPSAANTVISASCLGGTVRYVRFLTRPPIARRASENIRISNVFEGSHVYSKTPRSLRPLDIPALLSIGPAPPNGEV